MGSAYWGELRTHWRPLLAATMGLGFGIGLSAYTMSLFAPKMIGEFGWAKSQFALLGSFGLLMLIMQPILAANRDQRSGAAHALEWSALRGAGRRG